MSVRMEVWTYRTGTNLPAGANLEGFKVEATDGSIGKIDEASNEVAAAYIVVDTGPWIFGKKIMLPASVVTDIDYDTETVFVSRDKETIKNAPEFDPDTYRNDDYRSTLGTYYGPGGAGYNDVPSGSTTTGRR